MSLLRLLFLSCLLAGFGGLAFAQAVTPAEKPVNWFGTYQPTPTATPRLYLTSPLPASGGADICKVCMDPLGTSKPKICQIILCRQPEQIGQKSLPKVFVPPWASESTKKCPPGKFCLPDALDVQSEWPPKGTPGAIVDPDKLTKPYKGWLEATRIDADRQLRSGTIS